MKDIYRLQNEGSIALVLMCETATLCLVSSTASTDRAQLSVDHHGMSETGRRAFTTAPTNLLWWHDMAGIKICKVGRKFHQRETYAM